MNYNKLSKQKQAKKDFKTKYWYRENCNCFYKNQSLPTNLLHYLEFSKWCCKECSLMCKSEEQAKKLFSGKNHQNIFSNKIFCDINCWTNTNQSDKMPHEKKALLLNKKFHNNNFGNLTIYKNLKVKGRRENILSAVIKSKKQNFLSYDLSIYRTPSGKFYCQSCDLSVNSQTQFLQHTESRKHKHKANKSPYKLK